jgi:hypothetical protein
MDTSPGVVITISLALAIVLSACPAAGAFSFPAGETAAAGIIAGGPGPSDNGAQFRVHSIDESSAGKTVRIAGGDLLLVQLNEPDPDQAWHFSGGDGFKVVSDVVLESHPARHNFKVKASRPGDLLFRRVDRRDGYVLDTFVVHVAIEPAKSGDGSRKAHPLSGLSILSRHRNTSASWK